MQKVNYFFWEIMLYQPKMLGEFEINHSHVMKKCFLGRTMAAFENKVFSHKYP